MPARHTKKRALLHHPLHFASLVAGVVVAFALLISISQYYSMPPLLAHTATFKTNYGDMVIEFNKKSPNTVNNFIKLAQSGFYDGTRFHRVVKDLLIQGGDPFSRDVTQTELWGKGGPGYTFSDEIREGERMTAGVLAMVNHGPDSNGSQFFIMVSDADWLNDQHTIFGKVVKGMDVVMEIGSLDTGLTGIPEKNVVLHRVIID